MTDRELMGQALLALELWRDALTDPAANHALRYASFGHDAAKALRDRLAQPEREWVSIPDWEIHEMYNEPKSDAEMIAFAREFEAKLKDKNT